MVNILWVARTALTPKEKAEVAGKARNTVDSSRSETPSSRGTPANDVSTIPDMHRSSELLAPSHISTNVGVPGTAASASSTTVASLPIAPTVVRTSFIGKLKISAAPMAPFAWLKPYFRNFSLNCLMGIHCDHQLQQHNCGIYTVKSLGPETMETNPYTLVFHQLSSLEGYEWYCIHIRYDPGLDLRVYNRPTSSEVARIWIEDGCEGSGKKYGREVTICKNPVCYHRWNSMNFAITT
ncbi:hypothetical protein LIER_09310 [Lithospermum erythrorhizon]|uniref:Uncharacterized protein n=1 Tax=Lithospermum erythrorhizon TaxID=34254 RepID=A0AAV3PJ43_LITER